MRFIKKEINIKMFNGIIFDVDGVIADTPHEEAWRDSLHLLFEEQENWKKALPDSTYSRDRFTTEVYQEIISGKPRTEGAKETLKYFGISDPFNNLLSEYCEFKQKVFLDKISKGCFKVFEDAIMFLLTVKSEGAKIAAASSSKNANQILEKIDIQGFINKNNLKFRISQNSTSLLSLFDGNVCGIDLEEGKPNPEIFLKAALSIALKPEECAVVEDAVSGVKAAVAGNFYCIGIARLENENELIQAGADFVTNDLTKAIDAVLQPLN